MTDYQAHIARARELKTTHPFATEILSFYERVCEIQRELRKRIDASQLPRSVAKPLREQLNVELLAPHVPDVCWQLLSGAPAALRAFLEEFADRRADDQAIAVQAYANSGGTDEAAQDSREELVARIVVEPYAELLASVKTVVSAGVSGNLCALCGSRPVRGVLRVEGDGGKRFLQCAFCLSEWEFRRIYCAYCGEANEASLPVFVAQGFPQIRVEACDTCHHCLRTIDLTKDGNAVPAVDDLAAIPLGLWADEHGYQRICRNLLGT